MKITVLGMGHVGVPTAVGLAEMGWKVTGVDQDLEKIRRLRQGQIGFYEPELEELFRKHLKSGQFVPTEDMDEAIRAATVLFLCVGTPQRSSGEADLSQIEAAARTIARNLNGYKLIVEKSTVPAITAQWMRKTVAQYASNTPASGFAAARAPVFDVASNPEFLQEGRAVRDFFHPNRIVCGVDSDRAWEILSQLYGSFECPVIRTDPSTAELIKHTANAFLATKISFINMVADLCEAVGADVTKVVEGIGLDPRIGPDFLRPGIGFGGYCLPKDLRAFIHMGQSQRADFSLLKEVERINQRRVEVFLKKVRQALGAISGKNVAVWGLAFKPNTDDIREAPSIRIIEALLADGAALRLYDPSAMHNMQQVFPAGGGKLQYCATALEATRGAHVLLLLTEWDEFRQAHLETVRSLMEGPVLVDGRNLYDPLQARAAGFEYFSIGR